ncbi:hypothetical protein AQUCO_96600001v1 [Aquilegia coerulea]|uniref:Pentacotripeptide-repeat region of PRORP domain-containing protein n=1 Tax=Aquilegia coerulea TaxID=218851 RepID=A0A2G5C0A1_AQUCA|nr:hypothetical protein AQUCO_96600001v1 [Aquilegia coerulea]
MYATLIGVLCEREEYSEALRLLEEMGKQGLKPTLDACKTIIGSYHGAGSVEEARQVFGRMVELGFIPNTTTLNDLVEGKQNDADIEDSNNLLKQLA